MYKNDMSFDRWMELVDKHLEFVSHNDLPDIDYRGMYDMGVCPKEASMSALESGGFYLDLCFTDELLEFADNY
jgi:hypothetical protein